MVERALTVVIDKKMTEPQTKRLVEWVKNGKDPESYSGSVKGSKVNKLEGKGTQPIGDGSVDDGVAGFEKLLNLGIQREQQAKVAETNDSSPEKLSEQPEVMDPNSDLWKGLPEGLEIQKLDKGYRVTCLLSDIETPVMVYGGMAWLEHMKQKAKVGTEDTRYRKALPGLLEESVKTLKKQMAVDGSQFTGDGTPERKSQKPEIATSPRLSPEAAQSSGLEKPSGMAPGGNDEERMEKVPANEGGKAPAGLLGQIKAALKDNLKVTPGEITDDLAKDAKQAINYKIRKGMRGILKDWF